MRKVDSAIQLSAKHAEEARAQAQAELARTEVVLAQEQVQTERERAVAERSHEIALKRVDEPGEVAEAKAASEAEVLLRRAKAEAEAICARADAERARMLAESEGSRALIAAENSLTEPLMRMKLEQYRLDRMPEIVSQMMKPAEKIDSIRIHQVTGFGGSTAVAAPAATRGSSKAPMTQVMDSILGMALQLPALEEHRRVDRRRLLVRCRRFGAKKTRPPIRPVILRRPIAARAPLSRRDLRARAFAYILPHGRPTATRRTSDLSQQPLDLQYTGEDTMTFSRRDFLASTGSAVGLARWAVDSVRLARPRARRSSSARCSTIRATSTPTASRW